MMSSAPYLPDAFIGSAPDGFEMREQRALKLPRGREVLETAEPRMMERVHHFAVNIELQLVGGSVADAHRFRVLVSAEPRHLALGQPSFACAPVHDLDLRRAAGGGAQPPAAPWR